MPPPLKMALKSLRQGYEEHFDLVVSELPFGVTVKLLNVTSLATTLDHVLVAGGRAVLVVCLAQSQELQEALEERHFQVERREGNVGGVSIDFLRAKSGAFTSLAL